MCTSCSLQFEVLANRFLTFIGVICASNQQHTKSCVMSSAPSLSDAIKIAHMFIVAMTDARARETVVSFPVGSAWRCLFIKKANHVPSKSRTFVVHWPCFVWGKNKTPHAARVLLFYFLVSGFIRYRQAYCSRSCAGSSRSQAFSR